MRFLFKSIFIALILFSVSIKAQKDSLPYVLMLGIAQDAGYPQAGCTKTCCEAAWKNDSLKRSPVALAVVIPSLKKWWLIEASPEISKQLKLFSELTNDQYPVLPEGIFITHAHMGHYAGLLQLGREAMNTRDLPLYVMPRMKNFLETNGPWEQLVKIRNISLKEMQFEQEVKLADGFSLSAVQVVHRDEYSETAAFRFTAGKQKYLFVPDINNWDQFPLLDELGKCDHAFLDATFYSGDELPGRNLKEIPHPLVLQTISLLEKQNPSLKRKVNFVHFNHSNPLLNNKGIRNNVLKAGFQIAEEGKKYQ